MCKGCTNVGVHNDEVVCVLACLCVCCRGGGVCEVVHGGG